MSQQSLEALLLANTIRIANAHAKRCIRTHSFYDGCEVVATILDSPGDVEGAIEVGQLLTSIRHFGDKSLTGALRDAGVMTADKRVRDLTGRQREALSFHLRRRAAAKSQRDAA